MPMLRLGLFLLLFFGLGRIVSRLRRRFRDPTPRTTTHPFFYTVRRQNRQVKGIELGIEIPDTLRFELRREGVLRLWQRLNPPIADPQIRPGSPGFIFGLPARNADLADHVQLGIGVRDQLRFSLRREHSVPDQRGRARRDLQRRMTNRGSIPDRWIPKITAREGLRPVMGK